MKKITFILLVLAFYIENINAQCIPASAAPVFGTFTANANSNNTYNNVPTGNVIEVNVTVPAVVLTIDLCGTNPGAGPFPSGTNDSYVTVISENGPNATDIDDVDDGCSNIAQPGLGPGFGEVILTQGTYYLYLTEYDAQGNDECFGNDGTNDNYVISLTSVEIQAATNDNCNQPVAITVGTPVSASTIGATVDETIEGVGSNQGNLLGITAPCNPANGFPVYNVIWFSFNVATSGNYEFVILPNTSSSWGLDFVFYPQADVSCTNINQTVLTNAICKTASNLSAIGDRFVVTLNAGNYLIPVSTYSVDDKFEFTIEVNTTTNAPSCNDVDAGSVAITPFCVESDDTLNFDYELPLTIPKVGYLATFVPILSQQPITNFSAILENGISPASSAAFVDQQITAADFLANSPAGVYYYYIVAVGDANYEGDTLKGNPNCIDVASTTFEVKAPGEVCLVNTKSLKPAAEMVIYPNPAKSNIQVVTDIENGASYDILNSQGAVVANGILNNDKIIDVQTLSSGLYILSVKNSEAMPSIKHFSVVK